MKKLTSIILAAALMLGMVSLPAMADDVTPTSDYTVYSFETGLPNGFKEQGGAKASLGEGYSGSKNSLKTTLGNTSQSPSGAMNGALTLPLYLEKDVEYNLSFYIKIPEESTVTKVYPIITTANTQYIYLTNATITDLKNVGGGWYYFSEVFTPSVKKATAESGNASIQLRTTRPTAVNDNSEYLIDDLVIEPVSGYSNVVFEEDFEKGNVGGSVSSGTCQFSNMTGAVSEIILDESTSNKYVKVTMADNNAAINSDKVISFEQGKSYRMTYSAKADDERATGVKVMWHLSNSNYAVNTNDASLNLTSEWKTYSSAVTLADAVFGNLQAVRPALAGHTPAGGVYSIDNIKIEEVVPQATGITISGTPKIGTELTATITGDAPNYLYKAVTVDDNGNQAIVANGTTTGTVTYTPALSDKDKQIKVIASAYDDAHVYNTVESEPTEKIPGSSLKFTTELGETITGEAVQYEYDSAIAFMSVFDANYRLIGIKSVSVPKGETKELTLTLTGKNPAKAKLAMFNSAAELTPVVHEITLTSGGQGND